MLSWKKLPKLTEEIAANIYSGPEEAAEPIAERKKRRGERTGGSPEAAIIEHVDRARRSKKLGGTDVFHSRSVVLTGGAPFDPPSSWDKLSPSDKNAAEGF